MINVIIVSALLLTSATADAAVVTVRPVIVSPRPAVSVRPAPAPSTARAPSSVSSKPSSASATPHTTHMYPWWMFWMPDRDCDSRDKKCK